MPAPEVPLGHKVTVEVLNTTAASVHSRVARDMVRHAGLDVVYFGSAEAALRMVVRQSEVLVRRGDTTGVGRIVEAIGPVVVTDAPDRGREVDLTLLIGTDYLKRTQRHRAHNSHSQFGNRRRRIFDGYDTMNNELCQSPRPDARRRARPAPRVARGGTDRLGGDEWSGAPATASSCSSSFMIPGSSGSGR